MERSIRLLAVVLAGVLGACQPEQAEPVIAASLPDLSLSQAGKSATVEPAATQLTHYLTQTLHLAPEQATQLRELTLAQAREEQLLWACLADTARQQLHTIALKYDARVRKTMTPHQYRKFAQLRLAALRRRQLRGSTSHRATNTK